MKQPDKRRASAWRELLLSSSLSSHRPGLPPPLHHLRSPHTLPSVSWCPTCHLGEPGQGRRPPTSPLQAGFGQVRSAAGPAQGRDQECAAGGGEAAGDHRALRPGAAPVAVPAGVSMRVEAKAIFHYLERWSHSLQCKVVYS